ncbi:MAG TPA: hypothetical protein VJ746_06535 [Nitrospira sp.]|nr:hypothetical protein [Nitrospira sp.]
MPKKAAQPIVTEHAKQTPFEQFKAALGQIVAVPKSSLPSKTQKKLRKR